MLPAFCWYTKDSALAASLHPRAPHVEQADRPLHNLEGSSQAHLVLC